MHAQQQHGSLAGSAAWALLDADLAQQSGHKLRLQIPDTAIISAGVLKAWLFTNSSRSGGGTLCSTPRCQLSTSVLLQKLKGQHSEGWVAVAHWSDGLSWLVDAAGLEQLLSQVWVGAVPEDSSSSAHGAADAGEEAAPQLLMLQAYIPPAGDQRFVTTFGVAEGSTTSTQCRAYGQRYRAPASAASAHAAALAVLEHAQKQAAASSARPASVPAAVACSSSSSQVLCVDVASEALHFHSSAGAHASLFDGHHHDGSSCDTPTLGLASAAAVDRQRAAGLFMTPPDQSASPVPTAAAADAGQCCEPACAQPGSAWAGASAAAAEGFEQRAATPSGHAQHHGSSSGSGSGSSLLPGPQGASSDVVHSAPLRVAKAAATAVQVLTAYLDKALGLRVQGLVAEFIQPASQAPSEQLQLVLVGLPHLSLDPQQSSGGGATFTQRWEEFVADSGPPPAPAPAQHTSYGCRTAASSCGSAGPPASQSRLQQGGWPLSGVSKNSSSGMQSINQQFFPLLLGQQPQQQHSGWQGCSPDLMPLGIQVPSNRPVSAPRAAVLRPASPQHSRPATASPGRMRSAAAASSSGSGGGGGSTMQHSLRPGTAGSTRPGAGGNPVLRSSTGDSCRLWLQAPVKPRDSLTAQLAAQVEASREQVQMHAEAADAATLTAQCALTQAAQQVAAVQQELLQLREDAASSGRERRQLQQQLSSLQHQRTEQDSDMQALRQQLASLQQQLGDDRATLATMLRQHQEREQQLHEALSSTQQQNAELLLHQAQLTARLDEEGEVVSALRAQLVDYRLQFAQMQMQAKKGRTLNTNTSSNTGMLRRAGTATPPGQLGFGSSISGGLWGLQGGPGGVLAAPSAEGVLAGSGSTGHLLTRSGSALAGPAACSSADAGGGGGGGTHLARLDLQQQPRQQQHNSSSLSSSAASSQPRGPPAAYTTLSRSAIAPPVASSSCRRATGEQTYPSAVSAAARGTAACSTQAAADTAAGSSAALASSSIDADTGCSTVSGASTAQAVGSVGSSGSQPAAAQRKQPKSSSSPDAVVASMVAAMAADLGCSLAASASSAAGSEPVLLLIGDLLVSPSGGFLSEHAATAQFTVIAGLMQRVYGDVLEIFHYYAQLGCAKVVADRLTLELPQFGKLAYDLHLPQDNVTLSAVEDVFYALTDRKVLTAGAGKKQQHSPAGKPASSAAARGAGGSKSTGSSSGKGRGAPSASHQPDPALHVAPPWELLIPEQFPEALVRLACVRYRYGAINQEYSWDETDSEDGSCSWEDSSAGDDGPMSARTARMRQQQAQHTQQSKKGPRVLKPEGGALLVLGRDRHQHLSSSTGSGGSHQQRPVSPSRPLPEPYQLPSEQDSLATVVQIFLQHEVLKHGRRSKLAGSSLGIRRARSKPPVFQGLTGLPAGSGL